MNIYVGNLNYKIQSDELHTVFAEYGEVSNAKVIMDRDTGKSRGFGFVEMPDEDQGNAAIEALNGAEWEEREIKVYKAKPKSEMGGQRNGGGHRNSGGGQRRQGGYQRNERRNNY